MLLRQVCSISILLNTTLSARAVEVKTTYAIHGASGEVTTVVSEATAAQNGLTGHYLFATIAAKFYNHPAVTRIEFNTQVEEQKTSQKDYWEHKRSYPVVVHFGLGLTTLSFSVEETYRSCKSMPQGSDDESAIVDRGATQDCNLRSEVKVAKPIFSHNAATSVQSFISLVKDLEGLNFVVDHSGSAKNSLVIRSSFKMSQGNDHVRMLRMRDAMSNGMARILRVHNEQLAQL